MATPDPTVPASARALAVAVHTLEVAVVKLADHADAVGVDVGGEAITAHEALQVWAEHLRRQGDPR